MTAKKPSVTKSVGLEAPKSERITLVEHLDDDYWYEKAFRTILKKGSIKGS